MQEPTETQGVSSYKAFPVKRRSSMCDWSPDRLEWGVGKEAFESQDSCITFIPC